jgi:hypothetical protein
MDTDTALLAKVRTMNPRAFEQFRGPVILQRLSFGLPPSETIDGLDRFALAVECVRRTLQHSHSHQIWIDQYGDGRWVELERTVTEGGRQWRFVVKVHMTRAGNLVVDDADVIRPGDEDEDDGESEDEDQDEADDDAGLPHGMIACPCCGHATLSARGAYQICPVCFWEDDGQDNDDADVVRDGPNRVSLTDGRKSFLRIGASVETNVEQVRRPTAEEKRLRRFDENGHEIA